MSHQEKKRRLLEEGHHSNDAVAAADDDFVACLDDLGVDELANILEFLHLKDIMCSRRINKKLMEAAKKTIVHPSGFVVDSEGTYNAMGVMTRAVPNLQQLKIGDIGWEQQIRIGYLGGPYKYNDGEDPDEEMAARTADRASNDIEIISNFRKLRILEIHGGLQLNGRFGYAGLNGRYPFIFNSFPLLQKLSIQHCDYLKWDLNMLSGMPLLKELECFCNEYLTGNINSLRVLKDTLEKVSISGDNVEGNFMDLADFPHLKQLELRCNAITGDIRDIGENDFSILEELYLPSGVYGGWGCEFQRISDGTDLVRAIYLLSKQRPALKMKLKLWYSRLSVDSPDWYASLDEDVIVYHIPDSPPFCIRFVEAGSRIGYRWQTQGDKSCEVNWLDPEPGRSSSGYEKYIEDLEKIDIGIGVDFYRGFHQPPTEEEYRARWFQQEDNYDY